MKLTIHRLYSFCVLSLLSLPAIAQPFFSLQSSTPTAIRFRVDLEAHDLDSIRVGSDLFVRPLFPGQVGVTDESRQLPQLAVLVALPPEADTCTIEVISESWRPLETELPLAPPMLVARDHSLTYIDFRAPQAKALNATPPTARIEHIGWFRNLRVARIEIIPLRQQNGRLYALDAAEILLRPRIPASPSLNRIAAGESMTDADLPLYQQMVVNPEDVSRFARRARVLAKRSGLRAGQQYLLFDIDETGLYRIDGATLRSQGIDIAGIDPSQLRMYNNGGRILPSNLSTPRPDSLIEIPIIVEDGNDNRFDDNDAILFFGISVNEWAFNELEQAWQHYTNPFEMNNTYWLSWFPKDSAGLRLEPISISGNPPPALTKGVKLARVENEINNPISSGRDWYGQELSPGQRVSYTFRFAAPGDKATGLIRYRVVSKTAGSHSAKLIWNGQTLDNIAFSGSVHHEGYLVLRDRVRKVPLPSGAILPENRLEIEYGSDVPFGRLYVDWVEVIAEDTLQASDEGETLSFAAAPGTGLAQFQLSGLGENVRIFEFSNPLRPRQFAFERSANAILFTDSLRINPPRRYLATTATRVPSNYRLYTTSDFRSPEKGADLIIISHRDFWEEANRLADHKRSFRGFQVEVVDIETIMDEFAWGLLDPVAIRDFIAYAFHNWRLQPRYVLLFGDGTFDYRDLAKGTNRSFIPTYQSEENRLEELFNRNVEAFFVYVNGNDRDMDLAIGRLTPQTPAEARNMVDKIIQYESAPEYGIWRTTLTMVGDDELVTGGRDNNETIHVQDAERIVENFVPDYMNVRKIYLMQYKGVRDASISGIRKPGAQRDLLNQINSGTLILNFVGHGNSTQWTHEVIFEQGRDFPQIRNGNKLPFIVAATCDFGRFDKLNSQSFPENMLAAPGRGIIGIITSSRVVFASSNARFNEQYYRQLFGTDLQSQTIGEAMMIARLFTSDITNDEKYAILGDPSMKLGIPTIPAAVTNLQPDSLFALNPTQVQGQIGDEQRGFRQGQVELLVFDNKRLTRYTTSRGLTVNYLLPGNLLFRGIGTVQEGGFEMGFIVPKDITYGGTNARISLYGFGEGLEAVGAKQPIPISLRSGLLFDDRGPSISVTFEGRETFANGDPIPQQATMRVTLIDSVSGINVTAEIGHKITMTIDGDSQNQLDLTRDFVYFPNSFLGGQLVTTLPELPLGRHVAELKAWDNSNNSSTAVIEFVITERDVLHLTEVFNYPNPFANSTSFTFVLNSDADVKISIFTVAGRLIKVLDHIVARPGFNQVPWDGLDEDGDKLANGIYLYRIVATSLFDEHMKRTEFIGKLAVQR